MALGESYHYRTNPSDWLFLALAFHFGWGWWASVWWNSGVSKTVSNVATILGSGDITPRVGGKLRFWLVLFLLMMLGQVVMLTPHYGVGYSGYILAEHAWFYKWLMAGVMDPVPLFFVLAFYVWTLKNKPKAAVGVLLLLFVTGFVGQPTPPYHRRWFLRGTNHWWCSLSEICFLVTGS